MRRLVRKLARKFDLAFGNGTSRWRFDDFDGFWNGRRCGSRLFLDRREFLDLRRRDATTAANATSGGGGFHRRGSRCRLGGGRATTPSGSSRRLFLPMPLLPLP